MIRHIKFDDIAEKDLQNLIGEKVPEDKSTEYKLELPSQKKESKKEFRKDVSAFANAAGGDIDDFGYTPFVEEGGLGKASRVFGSDLPDLIRELNELLAA